MKITTLNNAEIVIQANVNKEGDWDKVKEVADKMMEMGWVEIVIASEETSEQWIHLTACWNHYQTKEIKEAYKAAKAA